MRSVLVGLLLCLNGVRVVGADPQPPNIVFILVDDLGWSDVGFNGTQVYETPNVDRLAEQGMVLSDFYSGGPVCSPTRASILTGKYPARLRITRHLIAPDRDPSHMVTHLPLEEFTLAEALRKNGYATGYFGKWHLGYENQHWASQQGFDVAKGGMDLPWAWTLCYPDLKEAPTAKIWPQTHTRFFSPYHLTHLGNGPQGEYLTERLTDETIEFIERHRDTPFFAFLSFHTVHTPLQAKPEKIAKYTKKIAALGLDAKEELSPQEKAFQNDAAYAAMVEHMDENVGRLLGRLDELQLSDKTIVVWTSDNGGKGSVTSNLPLRGMKHNLYEGGIRVPTIVRWPKRVAAGTTNSTPLISNDFYPTLLQLTGCPAEPLQHVDGISFGNVLLGKNPTVDRDAIYWHYPHSRQEAAVRKGRYKLLHRFQQDRAELYDLRTDMGERTDLSREEPEVVQRLLGKLKSWQEDVDAKFAGDVAERQAAASHRVAERSTTRPNVLFISVDDWNDWVGCLGHQQARTPNVDRLASHGLLFTNAHCVAPVCNPSRVATLTGLRPDTTGVYENNHVMRPVSLLDINRGTYIDYVPEAVTFPEHFRAHGYLAMAAGKVNHGLGEPDPRLWDRNGPDCGVLGTPFVDDELHTATMTPERIINRGKLKITLPANGGLSAIDRPSNTWNSFDWAPLDCPETDFPDRKIADWGAGQLQRTYDKPFLLALGFYKPHQPFFSPRKYFDLYDPNGVSLPPTIAGDLYDIPPPGRALATQPWTSGTHRTVTTHGAWRDAVRAYLATVSFVDSLVGRVIQALDEGPHADNTWIVLWSDHGWSLGEKEHWEKHVPWRESVRMPLMIIPPKNAIPTGFKAGSRCTAGVSLLDLYPTLLDACSLPGRKELFLSRTTWPRSIRR